MTNSLSGKHIKNRTSLTGRFNGNNQNNQSTLQMDLKVIKINILNNLIIPLNLYKWDVLYKNILLFDNIKKQLQISYSVYKLEDYFIYNNIIKAVELIINEHKKLDKIENKIHTEKQQLLSAVYNLPNITLRPEYEIYNIILGKPNRVLNEKYDQAILGDIERFLFINNATFQQIEQFIQNKYKK